MAKSYSYEVEHHDNGEVWWGLLEHRPGDDTCLEAHGFSHAKWVGGGEFGYGFRVGAVTQAHCEAFDAAIARCQWPDFPNAPRAA